MLGSQGNVFKEKKPTCKFISTMFFMRPQQKVRRSLAFMWVQNFCLQLRMNVEDNEERWSSSQHSNLRKARSVLERSFISCFLLLRSALGIRLLNMYCENYENQDNTKKSQLPSACGLERGANCSSESDTHIRFLLHKTKLG